MYREFVLPLTSTPTSIFNLLVANGLCDSLGNMLVSGVKNDTIIPDRVAELDVRPGDDNAGDVIYQDNSGTGEQATLTNMSKRSNRNSICLKDYLFSDVTAEDTLIVEIESV